MTIWNLNFAKQAEFGEDVLDIIKRKRITFHGCPPWYLEVNDGGDLKLWFYGHRNGKPWAGGVTIKHREDMANAVIAGDCNALADAFEQIIDHTMSKYE